MHENLIRLCLKKNRGAEVEVVRELPLLRGTAIRGYRILLVEEVVNRNWGKSQHAYLPVGMKKWLI